MVCGGVLRCVCVQCISVCLSLFYFLLFVFAISICLNKSEMAVHKFHNTNDGK